MAIAAGAGLGVREAVRQAPPLEKAGAYLAARGAARRFEREVRRWGWPGGLLAAGSASLLLAAGVARGRGR